MIHRLKVHYNGRNFTIVADDINETVNVTWHSIIGDIELNGGFSDTLIAIMKKFGDECPDEYTWAPVSLLGLRYNNRPFTIPKFST